MEFFLPQNLQTQLISYDPTLKMLARAAKPASKSTKPKFPLGQPYDIIPSSVIKTSLVQDAVDLLNSEPVDQRVRKFNNIVGILDEAESITAAILYHYESCWYAAWLPPKGQEDKYVYGYSYAYKNTDSIRKMIPYKVKDNIDNCSLVTYGRSEFITYHGIVTKDDIIAGADSRMWEIPHTSWKKGQNIRLVCGEFTKALKNTIPVWDDGQGGIFQRLKESSWLALLEIDDIIEKEFALTWKPSVDNLLTIIDEAVLYQSNHLYGEYRPFAKIRHIIDKPFFRKWIQVKCEECIERFTDTENTSRRYVRQPWEQIKVFLRSIVFVNNVWPDCPIDYYQTYAEELTTVNCSIRTNDLVRNWLQQNMPVASFFHIIAKFAADENQKPSRNSNIDHRTGLTRYYFHEWNDTVSMIDTVLRAGKILEVPKRWRITEFHDHVQAEAWKIEHANQTMPQDLFPTPVKVQVNEQTWTFFQPIDLHQLAAWGQAVRNCVGNASHYADGVKKKKHFIVLAMVDKNPLFTIQLEVNNGMMSVKQIKGVANQSLSDSERDAYTEAFGTALKKRNEELVLNPA